MRTIISCLVLLGLGCAPQPPDRVQPEAASPPARPEAVQSSPSPPPPPPRWNVVVADGVGTATKGERSVTLFVNDENNEGNWEEVISVVGSIVSIERHYYSEGGAHPSYGTTWRTIDLDTGEPVSLRGIFPEDEVFAALRSDRVIRDAYMGNALTDPYSLIDLIDGLDGECAMWFSPDMLSEFAFHHVSGDQVAIRIGLTHGCEWQRGNFTQLGLYLTIPPALAEPLGQAQAEGTLMAARTRD